MPAIAFNRYYRYAELTDLLRNFAQEFPNLVEISEIGTSHEGKPILLVTLTDVAAGPHDEKPAFWVDGNIHASEVSASTAALHLIYTLCTGFGKDETATRALKTRTFYVVPRLNPDGAEWALADVPKIIRSGTRPYPYDEEDHYGIERQDIDSDGRMLNMRVVDPTGPWKISEQEPRLMVRRDPAECGGTYYRILPEGLFHNYDGLIQRGRKTKEGLDFNRNFPSAWRLEGEQWGAGPYPTSEPEIRAAVDAICKRPNICGAVTFHTYSGVHLRPPSRMPDDDIPAEDLWTFKAIGAKATELTGYPAISNYHEFRYHPKEVITGVFDDWMYEHRGVYAWTTEIWSPQREAGITDYKYIDWFRDHPFEDDVKMLKWSDEKLAGKGYIDWYSFDHPQLGKVELGGWDAMYAFRNPPLDYLENEIQRFAPWVIWQALATPKLELHATNVEPVGGDAHRIRLSVANAGWLATQVTRMAEQKKLCRGVVGSIAKQGDPMGGAGSIAPQWLVSGKLREQGPQLRGWSDTPVGGFGWHMDATDNIAIFEWVVRGPGTFALTATHERAGTVHAQVTIT